MSPFDGSASDEQKELVLKWLKQPYSATTYDGVVAARCVPVRYDVESSKGEGPSAVLVSEVVVEDGM